MDGGSDCQAGVNVTFYELDEVQAQHLAGQFPFKHGRGELLDALKGSETWVVPNVNFGPPEVTEMGAFIPCFMDLYIAQPDNKPLPDSTLRCPAQA